MAYKGVYIDSLQARLHLHLDIQLPLSCGVGHVKGLLPPAATACLAMI